MNASIPQFPIDHLPHLAPEPHGLDPTEKPPNARTNRIAAVALEARQLRLACLILLQREGWRRFLATRGSERAAPEGIETVGPIRRAGPRGFGLSLARNLLERLERLPIAGSWEQRLVDLIPEANQLVQQVDAAVLLLAAAEAIGDGDPESGPCPLRNAIEREAEGLAALHCRWVLANRPLVCHLLQRHHPRLSERGVSREDCIQEGMIGLGIAAAKFQTAFGSTFSTYASYWILQQVRRYIDNCERFIRIPVNRVQAWSRVRQYRSDHPQADCEEISRALGVPIEVTRELLDVPDVIRLACVEEEACVYGSHWPSGDTNMQEHGRDHDRIERLKEALAQLEPADRLLVSLMFDLDDLPSAAAALLADWELNSTRWVQSRVANFNTRRLPA